MENMKEECNILKGKCVNMARDMEFSQNYMNKVSEDSSSHAEQYNHLRNRVSQLEQDLDQAIKDKNDSNYEVSRLAKEKEELTSKLMKSESDGLKIKGE